MGSHLRNLWAWCRAPRRRLVLLALVVGASLRLAWVLWATRSPSGFSDTAQLMEMARQFSEGETYRLNGHATAFHPPGYPLLLTPVALLARAGAFSLVFGAALFNVVASTLGILFGALLAGRWFGPRARDVAAWVLALAPSQIYLTNVALSETVFTAFVLGALLAATVLLTGPRRPSNRQLVLLGLLTGYAVLIRTPGAVLVLVAVALVIRQAGSWRASRASVGWLLVGVVLVLAPWTVRNIVEIGVWTPTSTNNAAFLCTGHHDGATGQFDETPEGQRYCFEGTAFGPDPEEAAWYGRTIRRAVSWAVAHPVEEVRLTAWKTYLTYAHDDEALYDSRDFGNTELASPRVLGLLNDAANLWHYGVLALAGLGLVRLPSVRRAWPLWGTVAALTVLVWGGIALGRYHHPIMPVLAVLAAATMVAVGNRDRSATAETETTDDEPEVLDAASALAAASRPKDALAGPYGHPFHPMVAALAIGAWVFGFGFDLISQVADTEWAYARGGWVLSGGGVAVGLVAALLGLRDLLGVPRGTPAFATGIRHLVLMDATLVLMTVSFLIRNQSEFRFHDAVAPAPLILTAVGLVTLVVGGWYGGKLAYGYGVRVAVEEDRLAGFEPTED